MFGQPRLGCARFADEQEGAIGGQRGDGDFDDALAAEVLGANFGGAGLAAEDVGADRLGREEPAVGASVAIGGFEGFQFGGVFLLGGTAEDGTVRLGGRIGRCLRFGG